jgi:hypothetical protein
MNEVGSTASAPLGSKASIGSIAPSHTCGEYSFLFINYYFKN